MKKEGVGLTTGQTTFSPTFGGNKLDRLKWWLKKQQSHEGLVQRKVTIHRGGKTYEATRWIRPEEAKPAEEVKAPKKLSGKKWVKSLEPFEREAVWKWSGSGYSRIRDCQKGPCKDNLVKRVTQELEAALDKAQPYEGEVFRGLHSLNSEAFARLKNARTMEWDALSSSSKELDIAVRFLPEGVGEERGHSVIFRIRNKSGVDLTPTVDGEAVEKEVILRRHAKYTVLDRNMRTYGDREALEIVLEEV